MVTAVARAVGITVMPPPSSSARASTARASISGITTSGWWRCTTAFKCLGVGHGHHLGQIGHLHGGRTGVAIHGDHPAAEALGGDRHLLAQLAAAEQHQGARKGGAGHGRG